MRHIRLLFWMVGSSMLLVGTLAAVAQSTDAESYTPSVAQFPVVNLGPEQAVFDQNVKDVQFDFADHIVDTQSEESAVNIDAEWLKAHPGQRIYVNGYADERGTISYNMTLSQKRAEAVKAALMERGVPEDQVLITVGFGKLYPICDEKDNACWEQNRRVHLVYVPPSFDVNSVNAGK